ncbi:putative conserved lipoprotein LpqG [Paractinoplanes deccanensis]|uniref:Conserved lipoprotein LpqG n=1 Tax=Paractinoplanes deccanensis TaxID=113561 RepID=A0ABQ3XZJ5_9ACTN|nr:SIMPL domain-containing protein [Actinoplanes deccanensis]GID73172.1 putative conserved lipoprotein LpqG [Actinoplanes deccanensis]
MTRSRFVRRLLAVPAMLVALSPLPFEAPPAHASAAPTVEQSRESIEVTGTGEAFGEPDALAAQFAVEAGAPTVGQALDRANAAATRMREVLARAKAELQTSHAAINSTVNDKGDIVGYTAHQGLTAKIRDLSRAGALMSEAIAAGGDAARLNGVSFTIENDTALLAEARKKAFADAREKAELYAREAGRPLGRVVAVTEASAIDGGSPERDGMAAADSRVPLEPGRHRLAVTVTVEWSFGGRHAV